MPRDRVASTPILGRFAGRAEDFGFVPPPVPLNLKVTHASTGWTVFLQSSGDVAPSAIVEWLPHAGLLRLEFGSRRVVRADFQALPEAWARAFEGVVLDFARVDPSGSAAVTVTGSRHALATFARRVYGPRAPLELVSLRDVERRSTFLTTPQDEALRIAVESGYYRIPRALNLQELAHKLGITSASLSERLRRAEGRIITRYVEAGSASPWDEKTIFDDVAPGGASIEWPEDVAYPSTSPEAKE